MYFRQIMRTCNDVASRSIAFPIVEAENEGQAKSHLKAILEHLIKMNPKALE